MTDLNQIVIIGRLTRNVTDNEGDFGYLPTGTAKANISIAVNRSVKKGDQWTDETSYFDVVIFGKTAENLKIYLVKGQQIAVNGILKQDRWQKEGKNYSRIYIIADSVQLLGGKKEGNNTSSNAPSQSFKPVNNVPPANSIGGNDGFNSESFQEDIPF